MNSNIPFLNIRKYTVLECYIISNYINQISLDELTPGKKKHVQEYLWVGEIRRSPGQI